MVYYISVKVTIDIAGLAKVIIDVILRHHRVLESIVIDQGLFFISKFWSLLCYFVRIKKKAIHSFLPSNRWLDEETK